MSLVALFTGSAHIPRDEAGLSEDGARGSGVVTFVLKACYRLQRTPSPRPGLPEKQSAIGGEAFSGRFAYDEDMTPSGLFGVVRVACHWVISCEIEAPMTNWRKGEPKVWRWRIRGRSSDSQMVTLGKYDTEKEARVEHDKIVREGFYRNVKLEELKAAPLPADADAK